MTDDKSASRKGSLAIMSIFAVSLMLLSAFGAFCSEGTGDNGAVTIDGPIEITIDDAPELRGQDSHFKIDVDTRERIAKITVTDLNVIVKASVGLLIDFSDQMYSLDVTFVGNNSIVTDPTSPSTDSRAVDISSDNILRIHGEGESMATVTAVSSAVDSTKLSTYSRGFSATSYRDMFIENCRIIASAGSSQTKVSTDRTGPNLYSSSQGLYLSIINVGNTATISGCELDVSGNTVSLDAKMTSTESKYFSRLYADSTEINVNAPLTIEKSTVSAKSADCTMKFDAELKGEYPYCLSAGICTHWKDTTVRGSSIDAVSGATSVVYSGSTQLRISQALLALSAGLDLGMILIEDSAIAAEGNAVECRENAKGLTKIAAGLKFGTAENENAANVIRGSAIAATLSDAAKGDHAYCMLELIPSEGYEALVSDRSDITMYAKNAMGGATFEQSSGTYGSFDMSKFSAKRIVDENGNPITDSRHIGYMRVVNGYLIHYEPGNHGTGTMEDELAMSGFAYMPECRYVANDGYRFVGWMDNVGNVYTAENPLNEMPADGITLMAVWEKTAESEGPQNLAAVIGAVVAIIALAGIAFYARAGKR